jgi:hypothetical protein
MKTIDRVNAFKLSYPKETPRISRKRLWIDRSEWREQPTGSVYAGATDSIDKRADVARNPGTLSNTGIDYRQLYDRAAKIGIKTS